MTVVCRAELLRLGLERLLAGAGDLDVTRGSDSPPQRRASVAVVSDRGVPDIASHCREIAESVADEVVVLVSCASVHGLLGCIVAGARGFVLEGERSGVLMAAVRSAARHHDYMGPQALALLLDWHRTQAVSAGERRLARERDLLKLLAEGRSTPEIARRLGVAPKTVRNRSSALYRRLGVASRAAAVRRAEEQGLLD